MSLVEAWESHKDMPLGASYAISVDVGFHAPGDFKAWIFKDNYGDYYEYGRRTKKVSK